MDERPHGLLAWQWELYPKGHADRRNLVIHILTAPLFVVGILGIPGAIVAGHPVAAFGGLGAAALTIVLQGRGHALERERPVPFRGPFDVAARLFAEQFVTFPRYLLSGGVARAWRSRPE